MILNMRWLDILWNPTLNKHVDQCLLISRPLVERIPLPQLVIWNRASHQVDGIQSDTSQSQECRLHQRHQLLQLIWMVSISSSTAMTRR